MSDRPVTWADVLLALVESCRDLGRGAIRSGEDPLDVLDRQLDHIAGLIHAFTAAAVAASQEDSQSGGEATEQ